MVKSESIQARRRRSKTLAASSRQPPGLAFGFACSSLRLIPFAPGDILNFLTVNKNTKHKMQINLTASWTLTSERSESRYGIPVLVNRHDDATAYGPKDIVQMYPSWGLKPAADGVVRAVKLLTLAPEQLEDVRNYLRQWPEGPQL